MIVGSGNFVFSQSASTCLSRLYRNRRCVVILQRSRVGNITTSEIALEMGP